MFEGVFRCLYARLHADQITDVFAQTLVERHEKIHRW